MINKFVLTKSEKMSKNSQKFLNENESKYKMYAKVYSKYKSNI